MQLRDRFDEDQIRRIRELLEAKYVAPSEEKKAYRDRLRAVGFYITDWRSSGKEFGPEDLDALLRA